MRTKLVLLTLFVIGLLTTNQVCAQVTDPLNQGTKVSGNWSHENEEVITKKKKNTKENTKESTTAVVSKESQPQEKNIDIVNSCPDDYSVELISLTGNRSSQIVTIKIKFTNHDINKTVRVKSFVAYNEEGKEFSDYIPTDGYDTFTDVPVTTGWEVGQMLPSKNKKIPAMSFKINDCVIEMRDVPIDWR